MEQKEGWQRGRHSVRVCGSCLFICLALFRNESLERFPCNLCEKHKIVVLLHSSRVPGGTELLLAYKSIISLSEWEP